jgi:hypothetical protein
MAASTWSAVRGAKALRWRTSSTCGGQRSLWLEGRISPASGPGGPPNAHPALPCEHVLRSAGPLRRRRKVHDRAGRATRCWRQLRERIGVLPGTCDRARSRPLRWCHRSRAVKQLGIGRGCAGLTGSSEREKCGPPRSGPGAGEKLLGSGVCALWGQQWTRLFSFLAAEKYWPNRGMAFALSVEIGGQRSPLFAPLPCPSLKR